MKAAMVDYVTLVVLVDGEPHPGWVIRAGDVIQVTEYDHAHRTVTVTLGRPTLWRVVCERIDRRLDLPVAVAQTIPFAAARAADRALTLVEVVLAEIFARLGR